MRIEQHIAAGKLIKRKNELLSERDIWTKELTKPSKLAYQQGWNNCHVTKFENTISDSLFAVFRGARLRELDISIAEIDLEFAEL